MKLQQTARLPVALSIAGSDSGGGAGIQADLRAFRAFGVHGCTAITALTAQNPHGVSGIQGTDPAILRGQLERIAEDFDVGSVKTGMLLNATLIDVTADFLGAFPDAPWVVDPVMVATSGARLLDERATETLRTRLLPHATLVTPNLPEAKALLGDGRRLDTLRAMHHAAERLQALLGVAVLVKGGHATDCPSVDLLCDAQGVCHHISAPTVPHPPTTHGTGCALSSAIAANLALGHPLLDAVTAAKAYLLNLLSAGIPAGRAAVYGPEGNTYSPNDIRVTRL